MCLCVCGWEAAFAFRVGACLGTRGTEKKTLCDGGGGEGKRGSYDKYFY